MDGKAAMFLLNFPVPAHILPRDFSKGTFLRSVEAFKLVFSTKLLKLTHLLTNKYIFLPRFHIESLFWIYLSKPMLIHLGMQALQMNITDISGIAGIR